MRVTRSLRTAVSASVTLFALASAAHAASTRTYVSNSGSDTNTSSNCGHPTPCATFAAAFSVTSPGGQIVALDVAGYGPLTINRAVTITAIDGALVNVVTGTVGITINAGPTDLVVLRNIQIGGAAGSSGTTGIYMSGGNLLLQRSDVSRLTVGLQVVDSKAYVNDTDFSLNGTAVFAIGTGSPRGNFQITGNTIVKLSGGNVIDNTTAYYQDTPGSNNTSIVLRTTDASDAAITVNHGCNATLSGGAGTGCPSGACTVGTYMGNTTYN